MNFDEEEQQPWWKTPAIVVLLLTAMLLVALTAWVLWRMWQRPADRAAQEFYGLSETDMDRLRNRDAKRILEHVDPILQQERLEHLGFTPSQARQMVADNAASNSGGVVWGEDPIPVNLEMGAGLTPYTSKMDAVYKECIPAETCRDMEELTALAAKHDVGMDVLMAMMARADNLVDALNHGQLTRQGFFEQAERDGIPEAILECLRRGKQCRREVWPHY